ncbi:MerR family DNA-binding protein [Rhodoligotrophos defluvii]|uniref:MerR family DNA-binding protein n=1 Tax=Rhodoligotrophos defluvii TaxID=2561934 RepID=UPI001EF09CE8|nr:MerR family DNA-binding protein [Rhodoligotrophos defluvii]
MARITGTTTPTIRYYEAIGLLPPAHRAFGGQRTYGRDDVRKLAFIRRCREFGFPIAQVRDLVSLMDDQERSCREARTIAEAHLANLRSKLAEIQALERSILELIESSDRLCRYGPGANCGVLQQLAEPEDPEWQ